MAYLPVHFDKNHSPSRLDRGAPVIRANTKEAILVHLDAWLGRMAQTPSFHGPWGPQIMDITMILPGFSSTPNA